MFALVPPSGPIPPSVWRAAAPAGWKSEEDESMSKVGPWRRCKGVPGDLVDLLVRLVKASAAAKDAVAVKAEEAE